MRESNQISKLEKAGIWVHDTLFEFRILLGVGLLLFVGFISICFNVKTGNMVAEGDALLPSAYGAIAVCGIFVLSIVFFGRANIIIKAIGVAGLLYIIFLDVFASLAYQIAADAEQQLSGEAREIQQLKENIATQDEIIVINTGKLKETKKHHSLHQDHIDEAAAKRDEYQARLKDLESKSPPPILAVFEKLYEFIPNNVDNDKPFSLDQFKTAMRSSWSVALSLIPYLISLLVFAEASETLKLYRAKKSSDDQVEDDSGKKTSPIQQKLDRLLNQLRLQLEMSKANR